MRTKGFVQEGALVVRSEPNLDHQMDAMATKTLAHCAHRTFRPTP